MRIALALVVLLGLAACSSGREPRVATGPTPGASSDSIKDSMNGVGRSPPSW
jgi:hypothetical protein